MTMPMMWQIKTTESRL